VERETLGTWSSQSKNQVRGEAAMNPRGHNRASSDLLPEQKSP
jgi:hypothetical protein